MSAIWWVVIVTAIDQLSKLIASSHLTLFQVIPVIDGTARLTLAHNPGGAFSLLPDHGDLITYISGALSIGLLGLLLFSKQRPLFFQAGLTLIAGGAWGNLIDRLRWGYVIDFIDVGTNTWRWPTFNLADSAIVLGTALLALTLIVREVKAA